MHINVHISLNQSNEHASLAPNHTNEQIVLRSTPSRPKLRIRHIALTYNFYCTLVAGYSLATRT